MAEAKCLGELVEMATAEGVTIDFCPDNKGILFEAGEVALFFELSRDFPELTQEGAELTGKTWPCPRHPDSDLREVAFPALDGLTLDICQSHGCVWFDQGEVPKFETLTAGLEAPRSRLARVFKQLKEQGYDVLGVK